MSLSCLRLPHTVLLLMAIVLCGIRCALLCNAMLRLAVADQTLPVHVPRLTNIRGPGRARPLRLLLLLLLLAQPSDQRCPQLCLRLPLLCTSTRKISTAGPCS
jgi:hypothetical protein